MTHRRVADGMAKITVKLSANTVAALNEVMDITEDDRIEIINHAIQLYAIIKLAQAKGGWVDIVEKTGTRKVRAA